MNLKDVVLGGAFGALLTVAVGGGIYSVYLKAASHVVFTEVNAYGMLGKCVVLNSESSIDRIETTTLLTAIEEKFPSIVDGDAVAFSFAGIAGGGSAQTGFAPLLRECAAELKKKLDAS